MKFSNNLNKLFLNLFTYSLILITNAEVDRQIYPDSFVAKIKKSKLFHHGYVEEFL